MLPSWCQRVSPLCLRGPATSAFEAALPTRQSCLNSANSAISSVEDGRAQTSNLFAANRTCCRGSAAPGVAGGWYRGQQGATDAAGYATIQLRAIFTCNDFWVAQTSVNGIDSGEATMTRRIKDLQDRALVIMARIESPKSD